MSDRRPKSFSVPVEESGQGTSVAFDFVINFGELTGHPDPWNHPILQIARENLRSLIMQCSISHGSNGIKVKAIGAGEEIGESGTPHFQGMIVFGNSTKWRRAIKFLTLPGNLEQTHGPWKPSIRIVRSQEACWDYCQKERRENGGVFHEWTVENWEPTRSKGTKRGASEAYDHVLEMIDESSLDHVPDLLDSIAEQESAVFFRCLRAIESTIQRRQRKKARSSDTFKKPLVFWFHGSSGTGKTRFAHRVAEACSVDPYVCTTKKWFDGIEDSEPFIIFDEFRRADMSIKMLLQYTDGYKGVMVEVKGGMRVWRPKVIIFTSPYSPHKTFCEQDEKWNIEEGQFEQIIRRIDRVVDFDEPCTPVLIGHKNYVLQKVSHKFPQLTEVEQEFVFNNGPDGSGESEEIV